MLELTELVLVSCVGESVLNGDSVLALTRLLEQEVSVALIVGSSCSGL